MPTTDWWHSAACRDEELPEVFFPKSETGPGWEAVIDEAKAICRRCPVRAACADWAINNHIEHGIWGGLTETERRQQRRRQHRTKAAA